MSSAASEEGSSSTGVKRPASSNNQADEPPTKYSNIFTPQPIAFPPSTITQALPSQIEFLLLRMRQQEQEIQQLRVNQQAAVLSAASTPTPHRRQTLSLSGSIPYRPATANSVPRGSSAAPAPYLAPLSFGLIPAPQLLAQPLPEIPASSPSPAKSSSQHQTTTLTVPQMMINGESPATSSSATTYVPPCFQRSDEEIYSNFIAVVRSKIQDLQSIESSA